MNHPLRDAQVTAQWMSRWSRRTVWLIRIDRRGAYMAATRRPITAKNEVALERYEGGRRVWSRAERGRRLASCPWTPETVVDGVARAIGVVDAD